MTMNNLITIAAALWQSGIAERAVKWAEVTFDGGQTQKAQAIKMITDYLMKADKAHLFTAKEIDEAIEWAVKEMKKGTVK